MTRLADFVTDTRGARAIVVVALVVAAVSAIKAVQLKPEDDLLVFLPADNPDVKLFQEVNRRFGGTEVALVGFEVDDPFAPEFLRRFAGVTEALDDMPLLDHVLSLTNVIDFEPDPLSGGVIAGPLVHEVPAGAADQTALRAKVMSRDHVVGNLIAKDGRAVVIYCYLAHASEPSKVASEIRNIVRRGFPHEEIFWGGGPFVSTYIYETTQSDIRRLTPWAVLAIVLVLLLVFRDIVGGSVVLLSTAIGVVTAFGLIAALDVPFNIMLNGAPVVLFAIGSAYGLHILARYYALAHNKTSANALRAALLETGPVVAAAGLTTAASLLSFVCMDIAPMRVFGAVTALGILMTLGLSLTFIPAMILLTGLRRAPASTPWVGRSCARLALFAQRRRVMVGAVLVAIAAAGGSLVSRVDNSVDQTTFFSPGSPPSQAAAFLSNHFGGSQFVLVRAVGDMSDPHVLRELRRIADEASLLENVSSVLHVGQAVALSNKAMVGQQRIPDTAAQLRLLLSFAGTDPALGQLVTDDRRQALIHVRVASDESKVVNRVIDDVKAILARSVASHAHSVEPVDGSRQQEAHAWLRSLVAWRLRALGREFGSPIDAEQLPALRAELASAPTRISRDAVRVQLQWFLRSSECAVEIPPPTAHGDPAQSLAALAVEAGPEADEALLAGLFARQITWSEDEALPGDLAVSVAGPLKEFWQAQQARQHAQRLSETAGLGAAIKEEGRRQRFLDAVVAALLDLDSPSVMVESSTGRGAMKPLDLDVSGLGVMHRGLSSSLTRNQVRSLVFALTLVLIIMSWLFRSVLAGLLATAPTLLTLVVVYGGMGLLGIHLDFGTTMLASIILGAGVDYAVHLLAAWQAPLTGGLVDGARRASEKTGTAIWTNAVMVSLGFTVLTLGEARPLQNVGGFTAVAMIVAAVATFLTIPVLARRSVYRATAEPEEPVGSFVAGEVERPNSRSD